MQPIHPLKNNQLENSGPDFLSHCIPIEIALKILVGLSPIRVIHVGQTSKYWHEISSDSSLWKHFVNRYFPHYRWKNSKPMEVFKFCIIRRRDMKNETYVPQSLTPDMFNEYSGGVMCLQKKDGVLYAGTCNGIIIFSLLTNRVLDKLLYPSPILCLQVSGDQIYFSSMCDSSVRVWDRWKEKELSPLQNSSYVKCIQEHRRLLYVGVDKAVKVWKLSSGELVDTWPTKSSVDCIVVYESRLYTSSLNEPAIHVRNVKDGTLLNIFQLSIPNGGIKCLAMYKNILACGENWRGIIHLLNLDTGTEMSSLEGSEEGIRSMQVDVGRHILYAISTLSLTIWNLVTGQVVEKHNVSRSRSCFSLIRRKNCLYIGSYREIYTYDFVVPDDIDKPEPSDR